MINQVCMSESKMEPNSWQNAGCHFQLVGLDVLKIKAQNEAVESTACICNDYPMKLWQVY